MGQLRLMQFPKIKFQSIPILLSLFTTFFVIYKSYNLAQHVKIAEIFLPFWIYIFPILFFFLLLLPVFYFIYQKLQSNLVLKLNIVKLSIAFVLLVVLFVLIKSLLTKTINISEIPTAILVLTFRILITYLYLTFHSIVWFLAGHKLINLLKLNKTLTYQIRVMLSLVLGLLIFTFGLLALSLLKILAGLPILILLITMLILGIDQFQQLKNLIESKITISKNTSLNIPMVLIITITCLQAIISYSILLSPAPMAYDSLSYYFNLAKELSFSAQFIKGQYSMPIELLYASGFSLTKFLGLSNITELIVMHWTWWAGMFGFISIYYLGKKLANNYVGILAGASYLTMPLVGFYMSVEPKSEIFVIPIFALSLLLFFEWIKLNNDKILFLISLLLGFVFTIKMTHLFGVVAFGIATIIYAIWIKRWLKMFKIIVFGIVGVIIVSVPWFLIHIQEQKLSLSEVVQRLENKQFETTLLMGTNPYQWERQVAYSQLRNSASATSGYNEDYKRYIDNTNAFFGLEKILPKFIVNSNILPLIKIPWNVTAVELIPTLHFMISPFYLAGIIPLIIYCSNLIVNSKNKNKQEILVLTLFTFLYFLIWLVFGKSVIWYGMGIFASLAVVVSLAWDKIFRKQILPIYILANILVIIPLLMGTYIQLTRFGDKSVLSFAVGKLDKHEAMRRLTDNYIDMADIINKDPQIITKQKYVILGGSFLHYFINNYFEVVLNDIWLDYLNAVMVYAQGDSKLALGTFRQLGVKYIVISLGTVNQDKTVDKTLTKKFDTFMRFASTELNLLVFNQEKGILLLQVPEKNN